MKFPSLLALALGLLTGAAQAVTCQSNIPASNPDSIYTVHGDQTVTDTRTGLMWKQCLEGQSWNGSACTGAGTPMNWATALSTAETATDAGHTDWRLPNLKELRSLVEECRTGPSINNAVFPGASSSVVWSGSPYASFSYFAWYVDFGDGFAGNGDRGYSVHVRLVRAGQSFAPLPALSAVAASGTPTGSSAAFVGTSSLTGTGWWLVVPGGSTAPTPAQVKAGVAYGSVTPAAHGSGAMTAGTPASFAVSSLSAATSYDFYLVAEAGGQLSAPPSKVTFTTATPINGACGSASGTASATAPAASLCSTGTATGVTGSSGQWQWGCNGSNGGTNTPANACTAAYASQTLSISANPTSILVGGTSAITASSTASLSVSLAGNANCTVSGTTATGTNAGTCTVTASQAGTGDTGASRYLPATDATVNITVSVPPPPAPEPPPPPATGGGAFGVTPGQTLALVNNGNGGTVLRLDAPIASNQPATIGLPGTGTLQLAGSGGSALLVQQPWPGQFALLLSVGQVTLAGQSPGQPLLALPGTGAARGPVLQGGDCAATPASLVATVENGATQVSVVQCHVDIVGPDQTATQPSLWRLYAGEQALWNAQGQMQGLPWLGSPSGNQGWAGDPLTLPTTPGLTLQTPVPQLNATAQRSGQNVLTLLRQQLAGMGLQLEGDTPNAWGGWLVRDAQGNRYSVAMLGQVRADAGLQLTDGVQQSGDAVPGNGGFALVQQHLAVPLSPAVSDLGALAGLVRSLGGSTALQTDGSLRLNLSGQQWAVQPGYAVQQGTSPGAGTDAAGHLTWTDAQGRSQTLYPVAHDFARVQSLVRTLDAAAQVRGNADGTISVSLQLDNQAQHFTLLPDYALQRLDASHVQSTWWFGADGKLYLRYPGQGLMQGFAVR